MWFKLDDGFATHPKVLAAGILAQAIQIRAICYASQNKTDGFIHQSAVALLLTGLERISIETATIGDYAAMGCDADEMDWPTWMVDHGLWERCDAGYVIHDYLDWNLSKKDYERWKKKLSSGGQKGMKARWDKGQPLITQVITTDITTPVTVSSTSTLGVSSPNSSESDPNLKSKSPAQDFEQFWLAYPNKVGKKDAVKAWRKAKDKPELGVILAALGRAITSEKWRKDHGDYIPNPATWLNQGRWDDQPTVENRGKPRPPPFPPKTDPIARGQWRQAYGEPSQYGDHE